VEWVPILVKGLLRGWLLRSATVLRLSLGTDNSDNPAGGCQMESSDEAVGRMSIINISHCLPG